MLCVGIKLKRSGCIWNSWSLTWRNKICDTLIAHTYFEFNNTLKRFGISIINTLKNSLKFHTVSSGMDKIYCSIPCPKPIPTPAPWQLHGVAEAAAILQQPPWGHSNFRSVMETIVILRRPSQDHRGTAIPATTSWGHDGIATQPPWGHRGHAFFSFSFILIIFPFFEFLIFFNI